MGNREMIASISYDDWILSLTNWEKTYQEEQQAATKKKQRYREQLP
jgi:hypothetical protein